MSDATKKATELLAEYQRNVENIAAKAAADLIDGYRLKAAESVRIANEAAQLALLLKAENDKLRDELAELRAKLEQRGPRHGLVVGLRRME